MHGSPHHQQRGIRAGTLLSWQLPVTSGTCRLKINNECMPQKAPDTLASALYTSIIKLHKALSTSTLTVFVAGHVVEWAHADARSGSAGPHLSAQRAPYSRRSCQRSDAKAGDKLQSNMCRDQFLRQGPASHLVASRCTIAAYLLRTRPTGCTSTRWWAVTEERNFAYNCAPKQLRRLLRAGDAVTCGSCPRAPSSCDTASRARCDALQVQPLQSCVCTEEHGERSMRLP